MGPTTRPTLTFARVALRAAEEALAPYPRPRSRKACTGPQLFAMLSLRTYLETDYRGLVGAISESEQLREILGISRPPHHMTLRSADARMMRAWSVKVASRMLAEPQARAA